MPASMACTDFLYYPAAFTRLGSIKNSPVPFVLSFFACKPNPQKVLLDSLGIAQGLVGIIVELVLSVMMAVGGYWAIFRRKNKTDYEEGELEEVEEVLKYSLLAMRDRKKKAKKGEQVPLRQDLVLSALWDELDELATAGGGQGYVSFRRETHRTAPFPPRPQPPRTAPPAHPLPAPPSIPVAEKRLKELWAHPQFDARV